MGWKFLSTPSARRATLTPDDEAFLMGLFLSTPSARRATHGRLPATGKDSYFYPRPPRGGRPLGSILSKLFRIFLSTPSARRATVFLTVI